MSIFGKCKILTLLLLSCRKGWTGPTCSDCIVADGCQHGTCDKPYECKCKDFWGGKYCDINLNACGDIPNPCQNDARCENRFGNFSCICQPGYSGSFFCI